MRSPRLLVRTKVIPYDIYSIDIVSIATKSLSVIKHNVETDLEVRKYNAVDVE